MLVRVKSKEEIHEMSLPTGVGNGRKFKQADGYVGIFWDNSEEPLCGKIFQAYIGNNTNWVYLVTGENLDRGIPRWAVDILPDNSFEKI